MILNQNRSPQADSAQSCEPIAAGAESCCLPEIVSSAGVPGPRRCGMADDVVAVSCFSVQ